MGLPKRDDGRHSYGEYCEWPEDVRYELIDGFAYAMAPAPSPKHQMILLELARQVANALRDQSCRPFIAPFDVRLPKENEADAEIDTVVQPDLCVVCDPQKLDEHGCRGAPDWVLEVLSPSTASHDQIQKRRVYERAGVREYWLVHPTDGIVTIYRLEHGAYTMPDIRELKGTATVTVLPGLVVDWEQLPVPPKQMG